MNPNRWKMYTYAVQRCQNEKKTLLFVLMESKGEEDIWRSCLQFSLSTRKKGGQKLRHSFLPLDPLLHFPFLQSFGKTLQSTEDGQSKLVHEIQEVVKETLQLQQNNCVAQKKVFLGTFTQWLKIVQKVSYYIARGRNFVDLTTRGKLGITLMLLGQF